MLLQIIFNVSIVASLRSNIYLLYLIMILLSIEYICERFKIEYKPSEKCLSNEKYTIFCIFLFVLNVIGVVYLGIRYDNVLSCIFCFVNILNILHTIIHKGWKLSYFFQLCVDILRVQAIDSKHYEDHHNDIHSEHETDTTKFETGIYEYLFKRKRVEIYFLLLLIGLFTENKAILVFSSIHMADSSALIGAYVLHFGFRYHFHYCESKRNVPEYAMSTNTANFGSSIFTMY